MESFEPSSSGGRSNRISTAGSRASLAVERNHLPTNTAKRLCKRVFQFYTVPLLILLAYNWLPFLATFLLPRSKAWSEAMLRLSETISFWIDISSVAAILFFALDLEPPASDDRNLADSDDRKWSFVRPGIVIWPILMTVLSVPAQKYGASIVATFIEFGMELSFRLLLVKIFMPGHKCLNRRVAWCFACIYTGVATEVLGCVLVLVAAVSTFWQIVVSTAMPVFSLITQALVTWLAHRIAANSDEPRKSDAAFPSMLANYQAFAWFEYKMFLYTSAHGWGQFVLLQVMGVFLSLSTLAYGKLRLTLGLSWRPWKRGPRLEISSQPCAAAGQDDALCPSEDSPLKFWKELAYNDVIHMLFLGYIPISYLVLGFRIIMTDPKHSSGIALATIPDDIFLQVVIQIVMQLFCAAGKLLIYNRIGVDLVDVFNRTILSDPAFKYLFILFAWVPLQASTLYEMQFQDNPFLPKNSTSPG